MRVEIPYNDVNKLKPKSNSKNSCMVYIWQLKVFMPNLVQLGYLLIAFSSSQCGAVEQIGLIINGFLDIFV